MNIQARKGWSSRIGVAMWGMGLGLVAGLAGTDVQANLSHPASALTPSSAYLQTLGFDPELLGAAPAPGPPAQTAGTTAATAAEALRIQKDNGRLPTHFEPNRGQTADEVKFLARGPGYTPCS